MVVDESSQLSFKLECELSHPEAMFKMAYNGDGLLTCSGECCFIV